MCRNSMQKGSKMKSNFEIANMREREKNRKKEDRWTKSNNESVHERPVFKNTDISNVILQNIVERAPKDFIDRTHQYTIKGKTSSSKLYVRHIFKAQYMIHVLKSFPFSLPCLTLDLLRIVCNTEQHAQLTSSIWLQIYTENNGCI